MSPQEYNSYLKQLSKLQNKLDSLQTIQKELINQYTKIAVKLSSNNTKMLELELAIKRVNADMDT